MKVTVCFDSVKVIVPCGGGDVPVKELIARAVLRYKKAVGKASDERVVVKTLQTAEDDAILDPDDLVSDVADDRDKLIAVFEEVSHRAGDGTSESSNESSTNPTKAIEKESSLGERPPSDGAAVLEEEDDAVAPLPPPESPTKSDAAAGSFARVGVRQSTMQPSPSLINRWMNETEAEAEEEEEEAKCHASSGDDVRVVDIKKLGDMLGIRAHGYKSSGGKDMGIFVQEIDKSKCRTLGDEPLLVTDRIVKINGKPIGDLSNKEALDVLAETSRNFIQIQLGVVRTSSRQPGNKETQPLPLPKEAASILDPVVSNTRELGKILTIELEKDSRGLGFTVTSRDVTTGNESERPLYVKNITLGGVALKDGRLQSGDRLLYVNGVAMTGKSQVEAVNILRSTQGRVRIQVSRQEPLIDIDDTISEAGSVLSRHNRPSQTLHFNIPLNLSGSNSLGISVKGKTSTHSAAHAKDDSVSDVGIYIKSVVPGGAAFKDGRLMPNDQILSINGENLEGKSNASAMECLRTAMQSAAMKDRIDLIVKRKIDHVSSSASQSLAGSTRKLSELGLVESPIDVGSDSEFVLQRAAAARNRLDSPRSRPKSAGHRLKTSPLVPHRTTQTPVINYPEEKVLRKRMRSGDPNEETAVERDGGDEGEEEVESPFQRDAVGRLSMSERRKTALDPSNSKVYQERQQKMAERGSGRSSRSSGRSAGKGTKQFVSNRVGEGRLIRSSSDEVLRKASSREDDVPIGQIPRSQTGLSLSKSLDEDNPPNDVVDDDDEEALRRQGRDCNYSFRRAVDHSFDDKAKAKAKVLEQQQQQQQQPQAVASPRKATTPKKQPPPKGVSPSWSDTPSPSFSSHDQSPVSPSQVPVLPRKHAPPARPINPESPDFDTPARRKKKKKFFKGLFRFGKSSKHSRSRMTKSPPANMGSTIPDHVGMRPRSGSLGSNENILEETKKEGTPRVMRRIAASEFNVRQRMYDSGDEGMGEERRSEGRPTPPLAHRHSMAVLPNHRRDNNNEEGEGEEEEGEEGEEEYDEEEVTFSESVQV